MEWIATGEENITKILGKEEVKPEQKYRLSRYVIIGTPGTSFYLKEMLTGIILRLSETEKEEILNMKEGLISGSALESAGLKVLAENHVLIPAESDEYQLYAKVRFVLKNLKQRKEGIKSYTILPTTGCNARCIYCYEEGMPVKSMSLSTARDMVEFICRTRQDKKIKLIWFGGEPLIMKDVITYVCEQLAERGVSFESGMMTNAILMTEQLARLAKETWHLDTAQVSVDGIREDYENRKKFLDPERCNYSRLMQAIHYMIDAGTEVTLRCNYDEYNLPGLKSFVDEIYREFNNSDKLFFYFAMLFQASDRQNATEIYHSIQELKKYMDSIGMHYRKKRKKSHVFSVNHCMADSLGRDVAIDPEGNLYHCEHLPGNHPFSSIYDPNYHAEPVEGMETPAEECKYCPFLVDCTPFFKNGCPDCHGYCREFKEMDAQFAFEELEQ